MSRMSPDLMEAIRARNGVEKQDGSEDAALLARGVEANFKDAVTWYLGDPGWAGTFMRWLDELNQK